MTSCQPGKSAWLNIAPVNHLLMFLTKLYKKKKKQKQKQTFWDT